MEFKPKIALALIATVAIFPVAAGCGGGSSSSGGSSSTSSDSGKTTASNSGESSGSEVVDDNSAEFVGKGPNGQLAKVGKEGGLAEKEAATQVLEESFDARESGDWATQCKTLSSSTLEQLKKTPVLVGGGGSCANILESQASQLPPSARANTLTGTVDAFRINQKINGFAFWHGSDGKDHMIPLIEQRGSWKLVSIQEAPAP